MVHLQTPILKNSSVSLVKRLGNLLKSPRFLAALGLLPVAAGPALALLAGFPLAALTGPAVYKQAANGAGAVFIRHQVPLQKALQLCGLPGR